MRDEAPSLAGPFFVPFLGHVVECDSRAEVAALRDAEQLLTGIDLGRCSDCELDRIAQRVIPSHSSHAVEIVRERAQEMRVASAAG